MIHTPHSACQEASHILTWRRMFQWHVYWKQLFAWIIITVLARVVVLAFMLGMTCTSRSHTPLQLGHAAPLTGCMRVRSAVRTTGGYFACSGNAVHR